MMWFWFRENVLDGTKAGIAAEPKGWSSRLLSVSIPPISEFSSTTSADFHSPKSADAIHHVKPVSFTTLAGRNDLAK